MWTSKQPLAKKFRLFRASVESVLLYGSETWTYPEYHQAFLGEKASLAP